MKLNRSVIFPLAVDVELSCCAACGSISFVRFIHMDASYIIGQKSCAGQRQRHHNRESWRLTPHDSRGDRAGRVGRFRGMRSIDEILNVTIDVEGAVSSRSKCTAVGAREGAGSDETCVYVVRVEELGRPFLANRG